MGVGNSTRFCILALMAWCQICLPGEYKNLPADPNQIWRAGIYSDFLSEYEKRVEPQNSGMFLGRSPYREEKTPEKIASRMVQAWRLKHASESAYDPVRFLSFLKDYYKTDFERDARLRSSQLRTLLSSNKERFGSEEKYLRDSGYESAQKMLLGESHEDQDVSNVIYDTALQFGRTNPSSEVFLETLLRNAARKKIPSSHSEISGWLNRIADEFQNRELIEQSISSLDNWLTGQKPATASVKRREVSAFIQRIHSSSQYPELEILDVDKQELPWTGAASDVELLEARFERMRPREASAARNLRARELVSIIENRNLDKKNEAFNQYEWMEEKLRSFPRLSDAAAHAVAIRLLASPNALKEFQVFAEAFTFAIENSPQNPALPREFSETVAFGDPDIVRYLFNEKEFVSHYKTRKKLARYKAYEKKLSEEEGITGRASDAVSDAANTAWQLVQGINGPTATGVGLGGMGALIIGKKLISKLLQKKTPLPPQLYKVDPAARGVCQVAFQVLTDAKATRAADRIADAVTQAMELHEPPPIHDWLSVAALSPRRLIGNPKVEGGLLGQEEVLAAEMGRTRPMEIPEFTGPRIQKTAYIEAKISPNGDTLFRDSSFRNVNLTPYLLIRPSDRSGYAARGQYPEKFVLAYRVSDDGKLEPLANGALPPPVNLALSLEDLYFRSEVQKQLAKKTKSSKGKNDGWEARHTFTLGPQEKEPVEFQGNSLSLERHPVSGGNRYVLYDENHPTPLFALDSATGRIYFPTVDKSKNWDGWRPTLQISPSGNVEAHRSDNPAVTGLTPSLYRQHLDVLGIRLPLSRDSEGRVILNGKDGKPLVSWHGPSGSLSGPETLEDGSVQWHLLKAGKPVSKKHLDSPAMDEERFESLLNDAILGRSDRVESFP